ncbi:RNA methyltransferase, TrmH family, group 1 [Natronoarchaeum philippinense]|uniref:RNA methyltransferase, TrmH family, group 1 n=1 Tax=Natronoarchaeum philippinense TaxID=558529 RepID=A0A285N1T8_NATPI|nr:RNA methyltransferase [Natronoarchaeum philippinense]SNZ03409.1 RNA methyltransferase, TrmH family, group 1 [Natronoarchaeum philippinense]
MTDGTADGGTASERTPPAVAVVDAQTPGNVGTIARAMKNFGFEDLKLVDPPELDRDSEAYGFAGQAREDILPNADTVSLEHLAENYHTVALTATTNEDARKHVRFPFSTPAELSDRLATVDAPTCLVFGREDVGLTNDELAMLDEICSIPASDEYPVLNLGQAATITLYELRNLALEETQLPDVETERADEPVVERLHDQFGDLLGAIDHPEEKRPKTRRLFRRLVGRAHPTDREARTLLGIFRRASAHLDFYADDADATDAADDDADAAASDAED